MTLIFDIEADNLLLDVKNFWVGAYYNLEKKSMHTTRCPYELSKVLNEADLIVGHNIIGYDLPVLKKLTGIEVTTPVVDTLILAKLVYYDKDKSWSHSLDAYGQRLGEKKAHYNDWSKYTEEMEEYNKQDVTVTTKLYSHLKRKAGWLPKEALELEQDVQKIITEQYQTGWLFDIDKARQLHIELVEEKEKAEEELFKVFKPMHLPDGRPKSEKFRDLPRVRLGITYLNERQDIKLTQFNPGSGNHIVWWVEQLYGKQEWDLTDKGNPKTDADTLIEMFEQHEWAKPLIHYLEVTKILGQLAEGPKAWLKLVGEDGRIHGGMDILGTVTGRATHSHPNMGQVPSPRAYKGKEARELFISDKGMVNVGCDLSGVELRCLAHYMYPYDKGRYASLILDGDIHTANQTAAGLETRDQAKTFIYSVIYGGGDAKVGTIIGGSASAGKRLKTKFFSGTPGYKQLVDAIKEAAKRKYLRGISGRRLFIRSPHSAPNVLLQSLGAYISKYWIIEVHKRIKEESIVCKQIGWIHDELQFECKEEHAERLSKILEESSLKACEDIGIRMPIHSKAAIGRSWYDVH